MLQIIIEHVKSRQHITTWMVSHIQGRRNCSHGPNTYPVTALQPIKDGIGLVITLVSPLFGFIFYNASIYSYKPILWLLSCFETDTVTHVMGRLAHLFMFSGKSAVTIAT